MSNSGNTKMYAYYSQQQEKCAGFVTCTLIDGKQVIATELRRAEDIGGAFEDYVYLGEVKESGQYSPPYDWSKVVEQIN
jgi:hypothetical protein